MKQASLGSSPSPAAMNQHNIEIKGIGFFLYDSKENLVCLHKRDKKGGNKWDCFGGEAEKGENSEEALSREVFEELGIEIDFRLMEQLVVLNDKQIFFIHFPAYKKSLLKLNEGSGFAWFSIDEAKRLIDIDDEASEILNSFISRLENV